MSQDSSTERFDLIFRGEVLEDGTAAVVREQLSTLLRLQDDQLDRLFTGKPVMLKKAVDRATALKYQTAFKKAGARLRVAQHAGVQPSATASEPAPTKPVQEVADKKMTLAERLAAQEGQESSNSPEPAAKPAATTVSPQVSQSKPATVAAAASPAQAEQTPRSIESWGESIDAPAFDVAEVGDILLRDDEKVADEVVEIDVSDISVADPGERLAEQHEIPQLELDLSEYVVADLGVDLAQAQMLEPEPVIDLEQFDLAEVGAVLVESTPQPVVNVDVSALSLAQPGERLAPERADPVPPPPDTSHLSLPEAPMPDGVDSAENSATSPSAAGTPGPARFQVPDD